MFQILITTSLGLEELLAAEASELLGRDITSVRPGQVSTQGELSDVYRLCLWSRLANRVLVKLAEGHSDTAEELYDVASSVKWLDLFTADNTFVVDFRGTNRQINNSQFGALKVKDAIVDHFTELSGARPSVSKQDADIRIQARLWRDKVSLYLDVSGQSLHQRHYRLSAGEAPVKEHVAVAMLMRSGWTKDMSKPLLDPMCGSGTVAIEGALYAANVAPGLKRERWGFDAWKLHDERLWLSLVSAAEASQKEVTTQIIANDNDRGVLQRAKQNADAAGVFQAITFTQQNATQLNVDVSEPGFIVSNPPYGERLGEISALLPLFTAWGDNLKQAFQGWTVSLLTSNRDLLRQLRLASKKDYRVMNGKLECQIVNYELDERNCQTHTVASQDNDFANRLQKNAKRLNKWLKSQNTDCYRLYDADLPEYNVAVDRYADWLVVQEYAPPKSIPEHKARKRLFDVLLALPQVTDVKAEKIAVKTRAQQKGTKQYEKVDQNKSRIIVNENGARFYVNPTDYLDTGLFLDHRDTRLRIKEYAKGKNFLNLFSYTGSVSVFAALGGARSVTTVDMSKTYLDWAKDNFSLNNLKGLYHFVQSDCIKWLSNEKGKYDLMFIDPPTFSNSKRMDGTWDVQRDHVDLLSKAVSCLSPGGRIVFSNNLRNFKLDYAGLEALGLKIKDISQQTIPEDFKRNSRIHHCFDMTLES